MVDFNTPNGIELIYTLVSIFIVFNMVFIHEIHVEKKVTKSRAFIAGNMIGLIAVIFIFFGFFFALKKFDITNFFNFGEDINSNFIYFTNIFRVLGIFFGITMMSIPYINKAITRDKVKYTLYSLLTISFYLYEIIIKGNIRVTWKYLLLLIIISVIYIGLIIGLSKYDYKDFFNKDSYGYFCLGKNFKDISLEQPLICPTNKLL